MNVGAGIYDKMTQEHDYPLVDSTFIDNSDGSKTEKCLGTKGTYVASNVSGNWEVFYYPFLAL